MRRTITFGLLTVGFALVPLSPAFAQHCQPYWTAQYAAMMGCGVGGGNGGNAAPYIPPPPTAEQIAAQKAYALDAQGVAAENSGDWAGAEAFFRQALEQTPNSAVIQENLGVAQGHEGEAAYKQGDFTAALNFFQQALTHYPANGSNIQTLRDNLATTQGVIAQRERDKIAAAGMQKNIQSVAESLSAAPSSDELDFQGGGRRGAFGTTSNPAHPGLDFSTGPAPVAVHSAADQLSSAARSGAAANKKGIGIELAKTESNCAFDTKACANYEAIPMNNARAIGQTPGAADLTAHLGSAARNDPQIQQSMAYYQKLDGHKIETQQKLAAVEQKIQSHDGDAKVLGAQQATLKNDLTRYQAEETKTQEQIKKRTIAINVPWIESPAPPAGAAAAK
jgi:tetratricopeptide (TPR) repeat protein